MKYFHSLYKTKGLTQSIVPSDTHIITENGIFEVSKDGDIEMILSPGTVNEERIRVNSL